MNLSVCIYVCMYVCMYVCDRLFCEMIGQNSPRGHVQLLRRVGSPLQDPTEVLLTVVCSSGLVCVPIELQSSDPFLHDLDDWAIPS